MTIVILGAFDDERIDLHAGPDHLTGTVVHPVDLPEGIGREVDEEGER
jgi:hypothetical protein